jgi:hypothetical protein
MLTRIPWFIYAPFIFVVVLISGYYARSMFDNSAPIVNLLGIEDGGCYANEVPCAVTGNDNYKVGHLSIWLDDKPLISHYKINRRSFEYPFSIATKQLPQGKHTLKVSATDASTKHNEVIKELTFQVDNEPLQAALVKVDGDFKVFQGRTLHVQFQVNKEIKNAYIEALSHKYPCVRESAHSLIYECFVPITCEENPNEHLFRITVVDMVGNQATLENKFLVVMYPFKKQVLAISSEKVKEEEELGKPEIDLEMALEELTKQSPQEKLWHGEFYVPVESRGISTDFGVLRTTQQRGKYRHNAVDLLGTPRAVIWAPQDGIIVLKERYCHSGNTIAIDHGCGILSLFFHLDSFANVNAGQRVKKGNPIGTLGKTGYASGYHLHWEMRINNTQVDPMQWTKQGF